MDMLKNHVSLLGHLGQDPELKKVGTTKSYSYVRFSLANRNDYKDKNGQWVENTQWFNLVAWGQVAEEISEKLKKGQQVHIEGKLRSGSFGEGDDKRFFTEVEVQKYLVIEKKLEPATPAV